MVLGFRSADFPSTGPVGYEHTQRTSMFYNGLDSSWYGTWYNANDTDDWHLWKKNTDADPSVGAQGGWDVATNDSAADVIIHATRDVRPDLFWDEANERLGTLCPGGTPIYREWTWNDSTKKFNVNATIGDLAAGVTLDPENQVPNHIIDSNGRVWFQYLNADVDLAVRYSATDRTTFDGGQEIATVIGTTADAKAMIFTFKKNESSVSVPAVGLVWADDTDGKRRFAYRLDSDAVGATWTIEDMTAVTDETDNHINAQSIVLSGDLESTILVATKGTTTESVVVHKRDSSGTWTKHGVETDDNYTRGVLGIDSTNEEFYVFYGYIASNSSRQLSYKKSAIGTISFGSRTQIMQQDTNHDIDNAKTTRFPVPSTAEMYVTAFNETTAPDQLWWNYIELTDPTRPRALITY